ncbi:MAG: tandem-95 repeat protein [Planctomycetes bacterium]|nr:tandem-95 repeat protein [Planctomycetota bacterium]
MIQLVRRSGTFLLLLAPSVALAQQGEVCAWSPLDPGGNLNGVVNTYYPATGSVSVGATSIPVGVPTGAAKAIGAGDLLLVIQMQDAAINATNTSSYGDGVPGDPASGTTAVNSSGLYEFVVANGSVIGGSLPIHGMGPNDGLIHRYTFADSTSAQGQRRYQVIRVPRYANATLTSGLTCRPWDGSTGGVLVIDVQQNLSLGNATVSVVGRGFRGGGGQFPIGTGPSTEPTDYRTPASAPRNGNKGEGFAGTPRFVYDAFTDTVLDTGFEGYPNGSRGRGAPGNAGGGGNNGLDSSGNSDNAGAGGGGNGGAGGRGGDSEAGAPTGGHGGAAVTGSAGRLLMGGGGGSGSRNSNSSGGAPSHGAAGGGIVIIRSGTVSGGGTINASGANALTTGSDGGGGGGAGGSVLCIARSGAWTDLAVIAKGGDGADAHLGGNNVGPGGGGGGGVARLSSPANGTPDLSGGANGLTGGGIPWGASSGAGSNPGTALSTSLTREDIPGTTSSADCFNNDAPVNNIPDPQSTAEDTPLAFSEGNANLMSIFDYDVESGQMEVRLTATNGALTLGRTDGLTFLIGDGTDDASMTFRGMLDQINAALVDLTFVPSLDYVGPASLEIHTEDLGNSGQSGALSDTDTISITVAPQNDLPVAADDAYATDEDAPLAVSAPGVLSNDVDPDAEILTPSVVSGPLHGTVTLNADGSFTYTPEPDFNGMDQFDYEVSDGEFMSNTATVAITVHPVNDPPSALDDAFTVQEDSPLNVTAIGGLLANDLDVENDPLTVFLVSGTSNGTLNLSSDGSFTYIPNANYNGPDSFTYRCYDGELVSDVATVFLSVADVNDPPVANEDAYSMDEDTALFIGAPGLLVNDSDLEGNPLAAVLISGPSFGSLELHPDGSFVYAPDINFFGTDKFTYMAYDGVSGSPATTVTITVADVRDPGSKRAGYCSGSAVPGGPAGSMGMLVGALLLSGAFRTVRTRITKGRNA